MLLLLLRVPAFNLDLGEARGLGVTFEGRLDFFLDGRCREAVVSIPSTVLYSKTPAGLGSADMHSSVHIPATIFLLLPAYQLAARHSPH